MNVVIKFLKYFICKYFGTIAIEKIIVILLGELVKRTDSKVDDEIYQEVFKKTETSANEVSQ